MINSTGKVGRIAGLFWLLAGISAGFGLVYVRPKLIVFGDATATANNILANEWLFRTAIVGNLFGQVFLLFFGLTVFFLFKSVSRKAATFFLTSILITVAIAVVNSLNNIAALLVLSKADYLNVFGQEQLNALMMIFLRLNNYGIGLQELFMALALFSFGLIILKSSYIPQVLGILLIIGSCCFAINTFTKILVPQFYPALITQLTMVFNALGGLPTILWLLLKGVKAQQTSEI